ncbi:hypothetical protein [Thalassovita aquimarina]|uniref:hypothetical protein n=1 Tax=Thalassovita aquimarina TaxID=2785917 RepID=UPI001BAFAE76|nr:hypothetical protein [Thalassovita aquimarina]
MKDLNARTLLEALTGCWLPPYRREVRRMGLRKLPPELIALAQRTNTFDPVKGALNVKERLDHS